MRKQKEFIKLLDQEAEYLGFEPYDYEFLRENENER